ncbi:PREDICTED: uncharacterized protein LOC108614893 [Drosophila arizonae]|uniref:Uncharacterized protein LOC108614893 n=1 Tax=Drosophila arizonae TaxID=7263 RepID=A0ABM1PBL5_DROAR|nr:PREDICTED: uncharacterized protein LOC108614893 [Drosophila arizonae]
MWTYMMAAARGDRVNTMMSSRRRPETESPKYGYNLSRPMYRTTRFVSPVASAPAQLGPSSCNPAHEELEVSGGLYAPFQPTLAAVGGEGGVCLPRKHLIANQTAMPLPMGPTDGAEPDEQQLHYPRSSCSNNSSWQQRELPFDEVGFAKDNREEAIDLAEQKSTQPRASDANYLENGRKLIQVSTSAARRGIDSIETSLNIT